MMIADKLEAGTASRLKAFLASSERPDGTLVYNELEGFLFAIACSPEMILPSDWLPLVFADGDANYKDIEEAKSMNEAIMCLYNQLNNQVVEGMVELPSEFMPTKLPLENLEENAPVSQWSNGFLHGHSYLEELWNEYIPDSLDEELGSCVMVLSFFADPELAEAYYKESDMEGGSLEQMAQSMFKLFGEAMASYSHMGRSLYLAILEQRQAEGQAIEPEMVGQHDPCPCGSGQTFEACCGVPKVLH